MANRKKVLKDYANVYTVWLDKNWVKVHTENFQRPNEKSKSSFSREDLSDILDPTKCQHPECCFAYNITGDTKTDSFIVECLPPLTYRRLATLWNLDPEKVPGRFGNACRKENHEEEDKLVEEFIKNVERDIGCPSDISEDLHVNVGSTKENETKNEESRVKVKENPYYKFLKKNEGFDIEQMHKTNLRKKAKKIIKNFLDWYQSLGGNDSETLIDDFTLQELFQIGFDFPAAKTLVIRLREMPTVPDTLAASRNEPKHSTSYGLRQLLNQDIRKENTPLRMYAFGRMLPKEKPTLRYKPPRNFVRRTWLECARVQGDLDTLKTVWGGLEKLRSTIAFSNWLKNHPEVKPPTYLEQQGLLQINYEEWNQMYKGFEVDADTIETVTSEVKMIPDQSSLPGSKTSTMSST